MNVNCQSVTFIRIFKVYENEYKAVNLNFITIRTEQFFFCVVLVIKICSVKSKMAILWGLFFRKHFH